MTDERKGLPSASSLKRLTNCPASWNLSRGIPPEPAGPDAESGTRIHKWLEMPADDTWQALTDDEQDVAERCMAQHAMLHTEFADAIGKPADSYDLIFHECRLWLMDQGGMVTEHKGARDKGYLGKPIFSGQFDSMIKFGDCAILIDYKTGRGDYQHAVENDQLRALAVMAARRWCLKYVRVAIVQPIAGPPTVADFTPQQLEAGYIWLRQTIAALEHATPEQANPGAWCQYCPAKLKCDRFMAHTPDAVTAVTVMTHTANKDSIGAAAQLLSHDVLKWHLDNLRIVGWYVDAVRKEAAARIALGVPIDGWELRESKGRDTITDVGRVWERLAPMGCSVEEFSAACTITKKALKPLVKKLSGAKGLKLDVALAECIDGATTPGKPVTKLVRVGETEQLEDGE